MMTTAIGEPARDTPPTGTARLYGALFVQRGQPMLLAALQAGDAVRQVSIDVYSPETEEGYQRLGVPGRMRDVARYYRDGGRMPNPLLVNIRKENLDQVRVVITTGNLDDYNHAVESGGDWTGAGYIDLPSNLRLWGYDGQHRIGGVRELIDLDDGFRGMPVPLSVTIGLNTNEEMNEFYEVNTNAKSVKTDLALEILRQRAQQDPDFAGKLVSQGKDWMTRGSEVARTLDVTQGPWSGHIQAPNEKKKKSDSLTMAQAQFVQSLKPVLDMAMFKSADPGTIAQVLNAYWKGIARVLPEPFAPGTSPKDWVIQKGPGAFTLHRAMPMVVEVVRARGKRLADVDAYADALQGLTELTGEATDPNTQQPRYVSGADFWRVGSQGVAGSYGGEAGRRHLFFMIQALLPKPSDEIAL